MNRLLRINTGLEPGVVSNKNEKLFQQFLPYRKAVETALALRGFNTRLKPGVNERARLHSALIRAKPSKLHRSVAGVTNQTNVHFEDGV